ncbi:MAG: arylsulfatase A-like enzyme/lysophospholipase L1-like esterase [Verrucomicrobiales bacterium]|jgi:arylsulfatase A-like enzyme/lysophospholipase L1-like esterase
MTRSFLKLLPLLAVAATSLTTAASSADRPNILFVFSDDHATEAISAYSGGRLNKTPNLDRIASEGMIFRNSFCANSICGPSRANILTGKHSHKNGFLNNEQMKFDGSQMTFPKLLQKNGYQTALMGKWHLVTDPTGFDKWEILPGQGSYYNPHFIQMDGSRKQRAGYCTDIVTDLALDWLKEDRDPDKPFLLMCQHKAPHRNWSPAPRHYDLFDDRDLPMPATLFDDYSGRSKTLAKQKMSIAKDMYWGHDMKFHGKSLFPEYFLEGINNGEYRRMSPQQKARWDASYESENQDLIARMQAGRMSDQEITKWKYQRYIKDYLRTVQAVDDGVGRLLDHLDATGESENTVVIYSSDQGFYLGEHGWYDKRWMFEESLEMPFLIRWPGVIDEGSTSHALIQNIDYAPTFLEMAGIERPAEIQGTSILPLLKDKGRVPHEWRDAIYYTYYGERTHAVAAHDGVRTTQHKLMFFPKTREWNLFDLVADPQELRSVHDDPKYADVLQSLKQRYHALRKQYDVNTATIPVSRSGEDWWHQRWQATNKKTQKGPGKLLFIGDSITQGWEGSGKATWEKFYGNRDAINLGFSGDRTEHALWRLEKGNFNGVTAPKLAVVMIGTNNTGHFEQEPTQTAAGVAAIVDKLQTQFPETKVLLLGVFPRGATSDDPSRKINTAINQKIASLDDRDDVDFLDISDSFLGEDGTLSKDIMPDLLHLSEDGYQLWAAAIESKVAELGGFDPVSVK